VGAELKPVFCTEVPQGSLLLKDELGSVTKVWLRKEPLEVAARLKFPSAARELLDAEFATAEQPVLVVITKPDELHPPTFPAKSVLPKANSNTNCIVRFITLLR